MSYEIQSNSRRVSFSIYMFLPRGEERKNSRRVSFSVEMFLPRGEGRCVSFSIHVFTPGRGESPFSPG